MHELALCTAIGGIVERHAGGRAVTTVHVDVGALRQVVPDSLVFCWDLANAGTPWSESVLEVRQLPVQIECLDCGAEAQLDSPVLLCPACDSAAVVLRSGDQFLVTSIELADA